LRGMIMKRDIAILSWSMLLKAENIFNMNPVRD